MPYIGSDGRIIERKPWSLNSVGDFFWGVANFFTFFFRSLFHLDDPVTQGQYGRPPDRNGRAPGYPRRRMGGFTNNSAPAPPPCGGGG